MRENQKIVIDLGSVCLELSFEEEGPLKEMETPQTSRPVVKSSFALGVMNYSRRDLEKYKSKNERVKVNVIGGFRLDNDISPALAVEVIESIKIYGIFQANSDVKDALIKAGKIL